MRRILPALFTVIFTCGLVAVFVLPPNMLQDFSHSALATFLFVSNIYFWESTDYFDVAADYRVLLHTWSLAVEEQYYVFWPLLLMWVSKYSRRLLIAAVAALFLVSLVASIAMPDTMVKANFYLIPTRTWELMCGALLALRLVPQWGSVRIRELAAATGMVLLLVPMVVYDSATPFPGATALLPCIGTAVVLHFGQGTRIGRALSLGPVVFVGLISYSLYLWHWPILAFLRITYGTVELPVDAVFVAVTMSFVLATLSWRFVERPFRNRNQISRRGVFSSSGVGFAVGVLACVITIGAAGFPARYPEPLLSTIAGTEDIEENRLPCMGRLPDQGLCRIGTEGEDVSVLFWGDSHAGALISTADVLLQSSGKAGVIASHNACAPLLDVRRRHVNWPSCAKFNSALVEFVESEDAAIDTVILAGRWALNATGERAHGEAGLPVRLVSTTGFTAETQAELFGRGLEVLVARLRRSGIRVVILGGVPEIGWSVPTTVAVRQKMGLPPPTAPTLEDVLERNAEADAELARIANTHGADLIPIAPLLCRPACQVMDGGRPVYLDDDHLTAHGARSVLGAKLVGSVWPPIDLNGPTN